MKERVHVMLGGGRQMPNLIGLLQEVPNAGVVILSRDQPRTYEELQSAVTILRQYDPPQLPPQFEVKSHESPVDAFSLAETIAVCEQLIARHSDAEITFNVTCATTVMSIAAYSVAQRHGCRAIYVDTHGGRIIDLLNKGAFGALGLPALRLEAYLACYKRTLQVKPGVERLAFDAKAAATLLAMASPADRSVLLRSVRHRQSQKAPRVITLANPSLSLAHLIRDLASLGTWRLLPHAGDDESLEIADNLTFNFLNGEWLEVFAASEANACTRQGVSTFSDVRSSIEIPSSQAKKEIDLACLHGALLLIASCKTEESPFKTEHLDELAAIADLIGGRFCKRMFITDAVPRVASLSDNQTHLTFLEQARQRMIVVVTGDDLPNLGAILDREATTPTYRPA